MSAPRLAFPAPWDSGSHGNKDDKGRLLSARSISVAHNDLHFFTLRLCDLLTNGNCGGETMTLDDTRQLIADAREYEEASR